MVQGGKVNAVVVVDLISDQPAFADLVINGGTNDRLINAEKLDSFPDEAVLGKRAVALRGEFLKDVTDARSCSEGRILFHAKPSCQLVSGLEADTLDVVGQSVWVFFHHADGVIAVGLVDADGTGGSHTVPL